MSKFKLDKVVTDVANFQKVEIVDTINKTRLFASFRNKKELDDRLKEVFGKIPKKHQNELWLFIGQFESTMVEGFSDEQ